MPNQKPLYISSGTTTQLSDTDGIKAVAIDTALAGTLSIGASVANAITIGQASPFTTTFPGDVDIQGTVNYIGGTEFTASVIFQENVTFGDATAPVSSVVFAASTTVDSSIVMGGVAAYRITNLADPTGPLTQDVATAAWVTAQIPPPVAPSSPVDSIQFNNAGAFGGSSSLQWNGSGGTNALAAPIVSLAEGSVPANTASFGKLWASSADQTLHFYDNSIDYLVTPNTVDPLSYAASVILNFLPSLPPLKSVTLTGDITFTTSNLLASRNISVRVVGDTVSRNLVFPAWKWLGGAVPTVLEANKTAILSLAAFSGADTGVIASWSYDGSDVVTDVTASSPLASSGGATPNISLTGIVPVLNGGTGQSSYINGELLIGNTTGNTLTKSTLTAGSGVSITNGAGSITITATGSGGTVTSVDVSGGTTGLTFSGGPITGAGTITMAGTLDADNGGTGWGSYAVGDILYADTTTSLAKLADVATGNALISGGVGVAPSYGKIGLTTHVSGTLPVTNGGTGASTFTVGAILFGNGTAAIAEDAGNLFFDNLNNKLFLAGVATTNTHTINIGTTGTDPSFAIASGGRIHYYDGSAPTNGQILIGDGPGGNFAKAALTAGTNIAITNGAGSISIGLTGQVAVANGGTGASSITAGSLVVGNGTSAVNEIAPGTNGDVLTVVGGAWASAAVPAATDYSVVGITTAVASKLAVQISGTAADASAANNGSEPRAARVAGIVSAAANLAKVLGYVTATFDGTALTGGDVGKPAYLSTTSGAGTLTKTAPSASGEVVAELGIIQAVNSGTEAVILWQPKSITVL
jgi:hypothetical protein